MNRVSQPYQLLNPLPLDARCVLEGEQQDWIDSEVLFIGLTGIVFTDEISTTEKTPVYYVSHGYAGQWQFTEMSTGTPDNVLTTDDKGVTVAPLVGGVLPAIYLPSAYQDGITRIGAQTVVDANTFLPGEAGNVWTDAPMSHALVNGDAWKITGLGVDTVTFTKTDSEAVSYQFEVSDNDLIIWSTADEKWDVLPFSNVDIMGVSFDVNLPVSGTLGGYKHGDTISATDKIVDVIKKILQERASFSYTNPQLLPNIDYAFDVPDGMIDIIYGGEVTVDVGYIIENYVITLNKSLGNYNELRLLSVAIQYALNGGSTYVPSGESGEIINLSDTDNDQVPDVATPSGMGFDINDIFPSENLSRNGIDSSVIVLADAFDWFRMRFQGTFQAPTGKTDNLGIDPDIPGEKIITKDILITAKRRIMAQTYTGSLPSSSTLSLDATLRDAPITAWMPTVGTQTMQVALAGIKSLWVAVPANVRLDYDKTLTTSFDKAFRAPGVTHQDVTIKLINDPSAGSVDYRIYKISNSVAYPSDSSEVLTVTCIVDSTDPHWDAPIS